MAVATLTSALAELCIQHQTTALNGPDVDKQHD